MNNKLKLSCLVLLSACSISSCTKPDITFGADYLDNNYTNVVVADTATVMVSTVYLDSFATSGTGKAVVGSYIDPYFGVVAAESYFEIAPPSYSDMYSNTSYDSIELIIKPNKSYYGDTTKALQIIVQQLQKKIEFAENKSELYNVNTMPVNSTILGSKTITIKPSLTDTISIRLTDALGLDLMKKLQTKDDIIQTTDRFVDYFKGLRISAGNSNAYMLGYSDSIKLRLHYAQQGLVLEKKYVEFTMTDNTLQFNHITINRTGTALASLSPTNSEINSSATNNMGYLQSATSSIVKITFPYLRNFLAIKNYVKLMKAELTVKPVNTTFNDFYPLPSQLRLSQTTQLNAIGSDITSSSSGVQYGDLVIDNLYGESTGYLYDITDYINTQIQNATNNKNGLMLSAPSPAFKSDFNRLLVGDKNNPKGSIQLRIYYLTISK